MNKPMRASGIYPHLDEDIYRNDPAIAQSDLKKFAENPRKFMLDRENPKLQWSLETDKTDSATKRQGRLFHLATLQPDVLEQGYAPLPPDTILNEKHDAIKTWRQEHPGKEPVRAFEWEQAFRMAYGIRQYEGLAKIIDRSKKEVSLFWTDPDTHVPCKARIDCLDEQTGTILDLKGVEVGTTVEEFLVSCYKWRYFVQDAFYTDGARTLGISVNHFILLAHERGTYKPDCFPVELGPFSQNLGRQAYKYDLECFRDLQDRVPALPDEIQSRELPGWAFERETRRTSQ